MRVVPLLIAAALVGIVAAGGQHNMELLKQMKTASSKAGKALSHVGKALSDHKALSAKRAFLAQQAAATAGNKTSTCDQSKFADATARVLQACPSLSGLISGSTKLEDFLPGFCGSECYNTLATELPANAGCLDENTYFLVVLITGCQKTPQCYSEAFVGTNAKIQRDCGDVTPVVDFTNITTAAEATVTKLCSSGCVSRQVALMRQFPECIINATTGAPLPALAIAGLMEGACVQDSGTYCGVKLKAFGKIDCESDCSNPNNWCTSSCDLNVNTDKLNTLCSPCTAAITKNLAALSGEADILVNGLGLLCSTASGGAATTTNPYCYPLAMKAYGSFEANPNIPDNTTMATYCSGYTAQCMDRVSNAAASMQVAAAQMEFEYCLMYTYSDSLRTYCLSTLESSLRDAETMRVSGNALCAQNAKGDFCMWRIWDLIDDARSGCSGVADDVTNAGCCMPLWNELATLRSRSFPATYLPSGTRSITYTNYYTGVQTTYTYTHNSLYNREELDRSQEPANYLLACGIQNTSAFWDLIESDCPTTLAEPPKRELPVALSWTRVMSDVSLKQNVENALRSDTANAMGVPLRRVVNGTLVENKALTIQLRPDTRRATASTTDSGCKYVFLVDGASAADASAAAGRLDAAVAAGTFVTPSTASTVSAQCTACMDARSTSVAQASAPVGGDSTTPSTSPAAKLPVFAAAVAAIAVAALL